MTSIAADKHPRGLYVLFATEMWERFSFYSMLSLFTLYLQDSAQGFGWSDAEATGLYSWYLTAVYFTPLIGGMLADRYLGYRRSVMIGGVFFVAGHFLLSFHSLTIVYTALACLVIGNGFFKPNVTTMVGNLYPAGGSLKDRAYLIFYFGINVGAFAAGLAMEFFKQLYGYHAAFAVAGFGMLISVATLWFFRSHVAGADRKPGAENPGAAANSKLEAVPESRRIMALVVIFLIVIVFWMAFHQNGSTLTYWANDNTDWNVSGTISNSINPFWILVLTFPLAGVWRWLDARGSEPSTPTKMCFGMALTGLSFFVLYWAAKVGEASVAGDDIYAFRVSPAWLISSYAVVTLGELLLSPMGLSLVSKVAPYRLRGMMMGGWFAATAIGNKLTAIGIYWSEWSHSTFFAVLGLMCFAMAVVLALLLRPLKKVMPGV